jgi:hypothetical protein
VDDLLVVLDYVDTVAVKGEAMSNLRIPLSGSGL